MCACLVRLAIAATWQTLEAPPRAVDSEFIAFSLMLYLEPVQMLVL